MATPERIIQVRLKRHKDGDFFMATSPDMKGLVVHGHSEDEVLKKLPGVIQDLLELDNVRVKSVTPVSDERDGFVEVGTSRYMANTTMAAAE